MESVDKDLQDHDGEMIFHMGDIAYAEGEVKRASLPALTLQGEDDALRSTIHSLPSSLHCIIVPATVAADGSDIASASLVFPRHQARIWDRFFELIEPYAARVPYIIGVGNHEYDYMEGDGGCDPPLPHHADAPPPPPPPPP